MPADMNDYFKKTQKSSGSSGGGPKMPEMPSFNFGPKMWIVYVIIGLAVLLFITKPFVIIDEGERGIKVTTGKYEPIAMEPGLHFL